MNRIPQDTIEAAQAHLHKKADEIKFGSSFSGSCGDGKRPKPSYFSYNSRVLSTELTKDPVTNKEMITYDPNYPFSKNFGLLRIYNGLFNKPKPV